MRNMSHTKNSGKSNRPLKLTVANTQPDADRPFNRLLRDREERETQQERTPKKTEASNHRPLKQSGTQQIMALLKDFNARLKRDEIERERLWKEMEAVQDTLDRQKPQTGGTNSHLEKWKRVMESNQKALHSQIEKTQSMHEDMQERIETVETTSGSVALRFDDVFTEQKRLSRRVDTAVEDKSRLLKKMENLEDALTQTQDTLRAKALVLLTDQAMASKTSLPQKTAYESPYTVPSHPPPSHTAKKEEPLFVKSKNDNQHHPIKQKIQEKSYLGYYATAASVVMVLAIAGVMWTQKKDQNDTFYNIVQSNPSQKNALHTSNSFEPVDMSALAPAMNAIEPSSRPNSEKDPILTSVRDLGFVDTNSSYVVKTDLEQNILETEEKAVALLLEKTTRGDLTNLIGVDTSLPQIVRDIEQEALADNGAAQHDLAAVYTAGHGGVKRSYAKAAQWFEQAAYNGVANARYNLGVLYHQGLGVKRDESYAIDLYRTAAHINHPEAQYNLGIAYIEGVGVPQHVGMAAHYFEEAATNNVMEAAYNLGLIYENGLLGKNQPDEALFWYKVASAKGSLEGRQALESLSRKLGLNPSDVATLISRISVLKPHVKSALGSHSEALRAQNNVPTRQAMHTRPVQKKRVDEDPVDLRPTPSNDSEFDTVIVAQIQEQLINLGLYPGPADGMMGPVTEDAVRSYQTTNNIHADGVASEDILVHMLAREFELNTYPSSDLFEDVGSQE